MTNFLFRSAVRSNVGLVRKNNQDSGYASPHFLLIADGMGGHAGGDVASAIAVARLAQLDHPDHSSDTLETLRSTILDANDRITATVRDQPSLGGMGTTVTALLKSQDRLALAHIGDSRAYLLRDDSFTQMTSDHTFVQMLVDEGRITPEEAEFHPQRSVVMRVLGDVGASPDLDLSIREARIGDRWLLCSDGLTGFADLDVIEEALRTIDDPGECAESLINTALEGGGADNITVVIGDVVEPTEELAATQGQCDGSVKVNPQYAALGQVDNEDTQPIADIVTEALPQVDDTGAEVVATNRSSSPIRSAGSPHDDTVDDTSNTAVDGAASPASHGTTATTAEGENTVGEDNAQATTTSAKENPLTNPQVTAEDDEFADPEPTRRWMPYVIAGAVVVVMVAGVLVGWLFIRQQYYVTAEEGKVAIYQGISQDLGPIRLSSLAETTDIEVVQLPAYTQSRLAETIPASSKDEANQIVDSLRTAANETQQDTMQGGATDANGADPAPPNPDSPDITDPANMPSNSAVDPVPNPGGNG